MSKPTLPDAEVAPVVAGIDELVTAVLTASRVLVGVSARSLAEVEDTLTLTLTQFRTLVVLDNHEEINLNTLADLLSVTSSTAMRMINRLLTSGMATRRDNPANRREVLLGVTDEGRRLVRQVTAKRREEITRIVATMPETRRDELVMAMRAFAEAAHEPEPRPETTAALGW